MPTCSTDSSTISSLAQRTSETPPNAESQTRRQVFTFAAGSYASGCSKPLSLSVDLNLTPVSLLLHSAAPILLA